MTSRRALLRASAAGALAGLLPRRARAAQARGPVVVVGGGPAGISASLELVERGVPVVLVEADDRLGGRVQGWTLPASIDGATLDMELGLHAVTAADANLLDLLRRYGLDAALQPLRGRGGMDGRRLLAAGGGHAPTPSRAQAQRLLAEARYQVPADSLDPALLRAIDPGGAGPISYLRGNPQDWLWEPLTDLLMAFGADVRLGTRVSGLLQRSGEVTGVVLGRPGESLFIPHSGEWSEGRDAQGTPVWVLDRPRGPLAWWGRCPHGGCRVHRVEAQELAPGGFACPCHGGRFDAEGRVLRGPPQSDLRPLTVVRAGSGYAVDLPESRVEIPAETVILAVEAPAFAGLARGLLPHVAGLQGSSLVEPRAWVVRYWTDTDLDPRTPIASLLPEARHVIAATLVHRLQERSAGWARARADIGGKGRAGSVIEVLAARDLPALDPLDPLASQLDLVDTLAEDLAASFPALARARVLDSSIVELRASTWFGPAWGASSVGVDTGIPGLLAAGEHVRLADGSARMERAVKSGRIAANRVLQARGLPQASVIEAAG